MMLETCLIILINLASAFFLFKTINCFTPVRTGTPFKILALFSMLQLTSVMIYNDDPLPLYVTFVVFPLILLCFFQGSVIQKISTAFIMYPIVNTLNYLAEDVGVHIFFKFFSTEFADNMLHLVMRSCCVLIYFLIYKILSGKVSDLGTTLSFREWILIDIICFAPMTALLNLTFLEHWETMLIYPVYLACLVTSIASCYLTGLVSQKTKAEMENKNLKLQQDYYEELEQNQMRVRKLNHDMNHHLSVLSSFFQDGQLDKARSFLAALSLQLDTNTRTFCSNSIVNAVINAKYLAAKEKEIDCSFQIDLHGMIPIDDISLCSIFSNTLDNAIEAAEKIGDPKERKLLLKVRYQDGYFSYLIENTKVNSVTKSSGTFLTDKKEKDLHGFGLSNTKEIVDRYKGSFDTEYSDTTFSVIILIPC